MPRELRNNRKKEHNEVTFLIAILLCHMPIVWTTEPS
jgi:hypothetical protein